MSPAQSETLQPMAVQQPVQHSRAPFACKYCGAPSFVDPADQSPPPDYCHEGDHGEADLDADVDNQPVCER